MKDGKELIITIGRQFGSDGSETGKQLVTELGLGFYDENTLHMDSDEDGIKESFYYMTDEKAGNKLLYKVMKDMTPEIGPPSLGSDLVSTDNLFRFQSGATRGLAAEGDCVFIERCADYAPKGTGGLVRMFLYGGVDYHARRITKKEYFDQKDVRKNIKRNDRERRDYCWCYISQDWQDMGNYDVVLSTAALGVEGTVRAVRAYLKIQGYELQDVKPLCTGRAYNRKDHIIFK